MRGSGRARLPMTSLIDVIFLLLLFFMLTSTFARFGEIPMTLGGADTAVSQPEAPPLFVRIGREGPQLNGAQTSADRLPSHIAGLGLTAPRVIVATAPDAAAQVLADTLFALRGIANAQITVLE